MNLIRLLLFALAVWLIYRLFFAPRIESRKKPGQKPATNSGLMVQCQYCQLHVPEQEALAHQELWFCSEDHRRKFLDEQRS